MKTHSLTAGLLYWVELNTGLGLSVNFRKPKMGFEPFFIVQFLFLTFYVAQKSSYYGWRLDLDDGLFKRIP